MVPVIALATLAVSVNAAPVAPSFDASLNQLRREVLAVRADQIKADELKKIDKNVRLTANQCWQLRGTLSSLRAQARGQQPGRPDPSLQGQLQNLISNMDVTADNSEVVRKQVEGLLASAVKDPSLAALAEKLYQDSRQLDSDAGYLYIEARNGRIDFDMGGYAAQGYQIERLADYTASRTPGIRENAKKVLDKIK
ncbi:MAG: hypothetical protein HY077_03980 [Elusimicrobia bacterium]|nr:hypothetical protein [Elusimicrobiota bacterium]